MLAVVLTGVAAGLAAASLSWMIHFVEHLAFGQSEAQSRIVTEGTTPERRMGALLCAGLLVTLCWTWLQVKGRPVVGIKGAIAADTPARRHPPFFEGTVHALLQIVAVGSGAPSDANWHRGSWVRCSVDGSVTGWASTRRCAGCWWPVGRLRDWPGCIRCHLPGRSLRWRSCWGGLR